MERSGTTRRRIARKRAVEDDVSVSSEGRLECSDMSLMSPSLRDCDCGAKRPAVDSQVEQSKRSCAGELSIVPWSAPSGEKRNLEEDRRNAIKETVHQ